MNIEKQTYLNTEKLQELFVEKGKAAACYGADSASGGVRFSLRAKAKVLFGVEFSSLLSPALITLDGFRVAETSRKTFLFEKTLGMGTHLLEVRSSSHGGFVLRVEGIGVQEGMRYFERCGGCSDESATTVFMKNGDGNVLSYRRTASSVEITTLSTPLRDVAADYDRTNGVYTSDSCVFSVLQDGNIVLVENGLSQRLNADGAKSLAIADGRTIPSAGRYMGAFVDKNNRATILWPKKNAMMTSSDLTYWHLPVLRVVSAQRGSILMMQDTDFFWKGYYFHPGGAKMLSSSQETFYYDEIPLARNRFVAPTAIAREEDGAPVFYYQREDGKLFVWEYGEDPVQIGYEDAFHPAVGGGGFVQFIGELKYQSEE